MMEFQAQATPCDGCPLAPPRAVASRGPVPARLLFLSGAPRYHEEREGVAFASPLFAWLEETLAAAGLDPAGVHYATLTGCRPPHQRPQRADEVAACARRLDVTIAAVAPEVVVACGPEAVAAALPGVTLGTGHGALLRRGHRRYYPIRHPYAVPHNARAEAELRADLQNLAALLSAGRLADEAAPGQDAAPAPLPAAAAPTATVPIAAPEPTPAAASAPSESASHAPAGAPSGLLLDDTAAGPGGLVEPPNVDGNSRAVAEDELQAGEALDERPVDADDATGATPEGPAQLSLF